MSDVTLGLSHCPRLLLLIEEVWSCMEKELITQATSVQTL